MEDRCVCCGEVIPEGRMVCVKCEKLQNTKAEVEDDVCELLFSNIDDVIDVC